MKPELRSRLGAFKAFRNFDNASPNRLGGFAPVDYLHRMRSGMSDGHHVCLYDPQPLHRLNCVEVFGCLPGLIQSCALGNGNHLGERRMRNGRVTLVVFHVQHLLHDVGDAKTAKIGCSGLPLPSIKWH